GSRVLDSGVVPAPAGGAFGAGGDQGRRLSGVANVLGTRLVRAIAEQDESALTECFAPDVELRALTPRGLRERAGAVEAASLISRWFGDSTELQLVDSRSEEVAD